MLVAGVDEVGRGPWAGPVVACAFTLLDSRFDCPVADSKTLSRSRREALLTQLELARQQGLCAWHISEISNHVIDETNILAATMQAMTHAVEGLTRQTGNMAMLWVDGNRIPSSLLCPAQALIKGDQKRIDIAAASIVAKCYRDALMSRLHQEYPHYGWQDNAGYGTARHMQGLRDHGLTPYHRSSFKPVRAYLDSKIPPNL